MKPLRHFAMVVCAINAFATAVQSGQSAAHIESASQSVAQLPSHADTTEGLRDLIQQLTTEVQKGNSEQVTTLTHNLIIPDFQSWFPQVFGPETGARMAQLYQESLSDFDAKFKESIAHLVEDGRTDIAVTRFQGPDITGNDFYAVKLDNAMQHPVPIYSVAINRPGESAWKIPGFFAFIQGDFRYIGWHAMGAVPNLLPKRIRVGGNVQKVKMIRMVMPKYPEDAKARGIQGTVVLHTVIDYDGRVLDLQWVSGPPELMQSAMDAVKQWQYQTTLLNGEPVQVDTTISVVYDLGHKR